MPDHNMTLETVRHDNLLDAGRKKNSPTSGEHFSESLRFGEHLIFEIRIPARFCAILVF